MSDTREERLAKNEAFFRRSNELLVQDAARAGSSLTDIICECSSLGCLKRLDVTLEEYEHVRSDSNWFLVAKGHEDPSIEEVVEQHPEYVVVEKHIGGAGVARAEDPRG